MSARAKVWHKRILAGTQEYSKCPYKEEVKELLIQDVLSGVITDIRYEEITGEPCPVEPPVNESESVEDSVSDTDENVEEIPEEE